MLASHYGHSEIVTTLVNSHTDVNIQDEDDWTALMIASQNGHSEIVTKLINANADVNSTKQKGKNCTYTCRALSSRVSCFHPSKRWSKTSYKHEITRRTKDLHKIT